MLEYGRTQEDSRCWSHLNFPKFWRETKYWCCIKENKYETKETINKNLIWTSVCMRPIRLCQIGCSEKHIKVNCDCFSTYVLFCRIMLISSSLREKTSALQFRFNRQIFFKNFVRVFPTTWYWKYSSNFPKITNQL